MLFGHRFKSRISNEAVDLVLVIEVVADRILDGGRRQVLIANDDLSRIFTSLQQPCDEVYADSRACDDWPAARYACDLHDVRVLGSEGCRHAGFPFSGVLVWSRTSSYHG
jgi:hypothetical protein